MIDPLDQERQYYQAKINLCFRTLSRAAALRATESLRKMTSLIKQAKRVC